jgi:excisionase family DNA binding protein
MKNLSDETDLMTPVQLAKLLGVPISKIYKLTFYKQIPHIKLGAKTLRFDPAKVQKWIAEQSIPENKD